jgi:hypothetical protein
MKGAFACGILTGVIMVIVITITTDSLVKQGREALSNCEAELPRSQHCIITAIPNVKEAKKMSKGAR